MDSTSCIPALQRGTSLRIIDDRALSRRLPSRLRLIQRLAPTPAPGTKFAPHLQRFALTLAAVAAQHLCSASALASSCSQQPLRRDERRCLLKTSCPHTCKQQLQPSCSEACTQHTCNTRPLPCSGTCTALSHTSAQQLCAAQAMLSTGASNALANALHAHGHPPPQPFSHPNTRSLPPDQRTPATRATLR